MLEVRNEMESVIRSLNWYKTKERNYNETSFDNWKKNHVEVNAKIVEKNQNFKFTTIVAHVEEYFKVISTEEQTIIEPLSTADKNFLRNLNDFELFYDSQHLLEIKQRIFPELNVDMSQVTGEISKLNLKASITIEPCTGSEEDLRDWFENFERIAMASGWSYDIQGLKIANYLKETALTIWQGLEGQEKISYNKIKTAIIKECTIPEILEETFHSKQQKEAESVIEYYYILAKLASKCYPELDKTEKDKIILKKYINSLLQRYKKVLIVADPKTNDEAKQMAKRAEHCHKEDDIHIAKVDSEVMYSNTKNNRSIVNRRFRSPTPEKKVWRCYFCDKSGHTADVCRARIAKFGHYRANYKNSINTMKCFKCGETGHMAAKCSNEKN